MSIFTSILTAGSNSHTETSENVNAVATDFVSAGIVGSFTATSGAYLVTAQGSPNMTVAVASGVAWVACTPSSQNSQTLRVRNTASSNVTIAANASGSTKYDFVYIQLDAAKAANPAVDASDVATLVTSRSTSSTTDNGTPPTYGLVIAVVTVANGASSITSGNIADKRVASTVSSSASNPATGWNALGAAMTYSANNGNKEFVINTSTDLSTTVSLGQKFSVTRGTTAPTQCMAFTAASSQYAIKASPAGWTFTSAVTHEAWIYLNSYTGSRMYIGGRDNGAFAGTVMYIDTAGQLGIGVYNNSSSNYREQNSYQSVPLKRWVHVAANWAGGTTFNHYINGISITNFQAAGAGTPGITQPATQLFVGGKYTGSAASGYFDGFISEYRVSSVAQAQATIQANMAISYTGAESNLVSLFQGNGNFADKTSNGNTLTATNSTIATQAANPYNNIEYGIITKISTTQLTIFTGTDYNIPNMTLSSPQYSGQRSPYGFPSSRGKWAVDSQFLTAQNKSTPTGGNWYNNNSNQLSMPTGEWRLSMRGNLYGAWTSSGDLGLISATLSTTAASGTSTLPTPISPKLTASAFSKTSGSTISLITPVSKEDNVAVTTQTPVYVNTSAQNSISELDWYTPVSGSIEALCITAESAYI